MHLVSSFSSRPPSFLQLRAAVHQLRQREPAAVLRASRLQAGAGGVQPGAHQLAAHRVHRQPGRSGHDRHQTHEHHLAHRRGEQVPQGVHIQLLITSMNIYTNRGVLKAAIINICIIIIVMLFAQVRCINLNVMKC